MYNNHTEDNNMKNNNNNQPKKLHRMHFLLNGYVVFILVSSAFTYIYNNYEDWHTDKGYNDFVKAQGYNPRSLDHKTQDKLRRQYDFDNNWNYTFGLKTTIFLPYGSK